MTSIALSNITTDDLLAELHRRDVATSDRIAYCVVTNPGGIDGMDRNDKGGVVKFASFNRKEAERKVDGWSHLEPRVITPEAIKNQALEKLDALERLVLGC